MENYDKELLNHLIDEAMEKKDRTVTIYISSTGTSVTISPIELTKPRWIYVNDDGGACQCSECGRYQTWTTPYCPECGEKLAEPIKEETNE